MFGSGTRWDGVKSTSLIAAAGFGTAANGDDIGEGIKKPLLVQVSLNGAKQIPKADTGCQDHDVDVTGHQPVGKIDRTSIGLDRDFPHRRADMSNATAPPDQSGHVSQRVDSRAKRRVIR